MPASFRSAAPQRRRPSQELLHIRQRRRLMMTRRSGATNHHATGAAGSGGRIVDEGHSITSCLAALKVGDRDAAQRIWEAYFTRLVRLARARLRDTSRRAADEEDVALSAINSVCRGIESDRFARLDDRKDLWQILVMVTVRKAIDLRQHEARQVRGGGRVYTLSDLVAEGLDPSQAGEPGSEQAAEVVDLLRVLMSRLEDPTLRSLAHAKLEGYTNDEIARQLGRSLSTVERKLRLIRAIWVDGEGT